MELNVREMAGRLKQKKETAESLLEEIRSALEKSLEEIAGKLKQYIAAKLLLSEAEVSDNIIEMDQDQCGESIAYDRGTAQRNGSSGKMRKCAGGVVQAGIAVY